MRFEWPDLITGSILLGILILALSAMLGLHYSERITNQCLVEASKHLTVIQAKELCK
jgi:hypothetical protein